MKSSTLKWLIVHGVFVWLTGLYVQPAQAADDWVRYHDLNYVVVTPQGPKDGGDFGPYTPGTKTAGIQEAIEYARTGPWPQPRVSPEGWARKHVYICKGWYFMDETLVIPWMGEQFRLEGLDSHIQYSGKTGNAIVIDSQMNCHIKIGYVVADKLKEGIVVHCRPQSPFPHAPKGVMSNTIFEFYAIVGGGNIAPDTNKTTQCKGLVLDSSSGPIICNKFIINEINACDTGMYLCNPSNGGGIQHNRISMFFGNICNTTLRMGDPGCGSIIENSLDLNCNGKVGARIFAQRNLFTLSGLNTEPKQSIIFEADARDNLVYALNLNKCITNNAAVPTNRIISGSIVGYSIESPAVPESEKDVVNRHPYTVEVRILDSGKVTGWTQTDANGTALTIPAALMAGQNFILDPGDKIKFDYSKAPTWKWKALR